MLDMDMVEQLDLKLLSVEQQIVLLLLQC